MWLQRVQSFTNLTTCLKALESLKVNIFEVNPEIKPVIYPPRKVPFTLSPKLKQELEKMEQLGDIEKVDQPMG